MSMFEAIFEMRRQNQKDKQYLSQAYDQKGERRYSEDYYTNPCVLGQGGYGFVRLARRKSKADTKENHLATKVIAKDCLEDWQKVKGTIAEAKILMNMSHQNIVKVEGLYQNSCYYQLIMERCPGITLFMLVELNHHLQENSARLIFRQVLDAIGYLHEKNIVHNDIKDENIIVTTELKVTIIDFGSATFDDGEKTRIYCGSETYTSPEVLSGARFNRVGQEIWSLGVLLFVMVYGENPFANVVKAEECILHFPTSIQVSMTCMQLLSSVLTKDVAARPGVKKMAGNEWVMIGNPENMGNQLSFE